METAFANIEKEGKNDLESLMKWMKDSKVLSQTKEEEEKIRKLLENAADKGKITVDEFKDVLDKVSKDAKKNLDSLKKQLEESAPKFIKELTQAAEDAATSLKGTMDGVVKDLESGELETAFANIAREGKNDLDNLVKWMKDSKVISQTKEEEEKIRKLLENAADKGKITVDEFKDVLNKVSKDAKKNLDSLKKQLEESAPKFIKELTQAAEDAATSLKGTMDGVVKDLAK